MSLIQVSEARAKLAELVEEADGEEVVLLKHGKPVGVLLSHDGFERLVDRIEDLEDEVSVLRAKGDGEYVSLDEARGELDARESQLVNG